jgi:hypothetical protein
VSRADLDRRARALLLAPAVIAKAPPAGAGDEGDPADLAALWALCDGLHLADRTRLLGRAEAARATAWLRDEKSLDWPEELLVLGERDDLVIVHDADRSGERAGGGVLEAPTDALSSFRRAALDAVAYLSLRAGIDGADPSPAPERAAREAALAGDAVALAAALDRAFYPGSNRDRALAAHDLGALFARAGDREGALAAFARSAELRALAAPRGAAAAEARSAWRAAAVAAEKAGAPDLSSACRSRAADLG